jgi:hypothetical protein
MALVGGILGMALRQDQCSGWIESRQTLLLVGGRRDQNREKYFSRRRLYETPFIVRSSSLGTGWSISSLLVEGLQQLELLEQASPFEHRFAFTASIMFDLASVAQ